MDRSAGNLLWRAEKAEVQCFAGDRGIWGFNFAQFRDGFGGFRLGPMDETAWSRPSAKDSHAVIWDVPSLVLESVGPLYVDMSSRMGARRGLVGRGGGRSRGLSVSAIYENI